MEWSSEDRNYCFHVARKKVSNRTLYARRKTTAMILFFFCRDHSVAEYEQSFTSLVEEKMIGKNYELSSTCSKEEVYPQFSRMKPPG